MDSVTPVSVIEKQHKRRRSIDKDLAAILEVLNSRAATNRVPLIRPGFNRATRIFEISQIVQANQDEFMQFAEESCRLVYSIYLKLADKHEIELNDLRSTKKKGKELYNLEQFLDTLQSIEAFGEKCAARGTVKAALLSGFDINEIKAQRWKLERSMRLFGFQSLLDLREKTNQLVAPHGKVGDVSNTATDKDIISETTKLGGVSNTTTSKDIISKTKISFGNHHIQEIWMSFFILTLLVLMCFARE